MTLQYNILPLALSDDHFILAKRGILIPPLREIGAVSFKVGRFHETATLNGDFNIIDPTIYVDIGRFVLSTNILFDRYVDIFRRNIGRFEVASNLKTPVISQSNIGTVYNWLRNGYNFIYGLLSQMPGDGEGQYGPGYMSVKGTTGTVFSGSNNKVSSISENYYGYHAFTIIVGSSDQSFDVNGNDLVSRIFNGTGSSYLKYEEVETSLFYNKGIWRVQLKGGFTNLSGSSKTIREVGLQKNFYPYDEIHYPFVFCRDILKKPITIAVDQTGYITYELWFDFREIDNV